jgi:hypothetical protein
LNWPFCMNVPWPKKYQVKEPLPLKASPQVQTAGGLELPLLDDELTLALPDAEPPETEEDEVPVLAAVVAPVPISLVALLVAVEAVLVELPPVPLSPPSGVKSLKPRTSAQPIVATEEAIVIRNASRASRAIKKTSRRTKFRYPSLAPQVPSWSHRFGQES